MMQRSARLAFTRSAISSELRAFADSRYLRQRDKEIGLKVGYARTSGVEQQAGLDAQFRDLKAAGCEKIFSELGCEAVQAGIERLR
jgi:hypothetical protein